MAYANGRIPTSALAGVPGFAGAYLTHEAAGAFGRVRGEVARRYGWTPTLTSAGDAYRSYERQEAVFRQRYVPRYATYGLGGVDRRGPWLGLYWWRYTGAAAAVPGTSNHGKGVAVDIKDMGPFSGSRYRQFEDVATEHGWSNAEGRSVNEPWHWVYSSSRDTYTISNPGTTVGDVPDVPDISFIDPIELSEKEDDMLRIITNGDVWATTDGLHKRVITSDYDIQTILDLRLVTQDDVTAARNGQKAVSTYLWDLIKTV